MSDTQPERPLETTTGTGTAAAGDVVGPTQDPPRSAGIGAGDGVSATLWVNGKKVNGLWSINQNRNVFLGVAGVGWVKLANNSDSAIVALTMLGTNAKITQGSVSYRQEADKMIHEMYVW